MRHAIRFGRPGMLALGLGIGAALASTPGVAAADSSTDPFTWIDQMLGGLSVPAQTTSALDYQVSISGMELFPTAGNTATATSQFGDIAIAIGNGANANASGGIFDLAVADGTDSYANTGVGANLDSAFADGTNSYANVGVGASLDNATAVGTDSYANTGVGANLDSAFADGTSSAANAGVGNYDLATAIGAGSSANASVGINDFASAAGGGDATASGFLATAVANGANSAAVASGLSDTATAYGTNAEANAVVGIGDFASVINTGSALDQAIAGGGGPLSSNFDIAEIFGTGSTALAGSGGSFDLAAAFGDMLDAHATGANFLIDILPALF